MRTIGVKVTLDYRDYVNGSDRISSATKDFTSQMDKAAKAGHLDKVADQAAKFGLVGVAAFGLVVKSAAEFDKQMSAVSAATHANTQDMAALRAAALAAGKDTQYSATEAAKGITELSKAGVETSQILGGGLKGALSLAAAGQLDVAEAAETAASAMTQFKLNGDQVPHVADLLASAAGHAQGSVHDLGYALSQSGLVASQMGLSIEDATGTLAAFASAGLLGSDAGTSFKTMLLALQNPVPKTAELMKQLGINAYDAQGNFVGVAKFAGILQEKLKNLTPQMRQQALAQIFGNDAVRAGTILYDQGAKGIQGWIDKTNDAGFAASTAAKLTDNLSGDIERLKGSLETLAIQSGSGANSGLRVLTKGVNGLANEFLGLPPAIGSTVTVLAGVTGVVALGLAGFIKLRKGVAEAVTQLNAMGPSGEKAATGLGTIASAAGKAAVAFAVWQAAMAAADAIQGNTATNVEAMTVGLQKFGQGANLSGEAARVLGGNLQNLTTGFKYLADTDNGRVKVVKSLQQSLEAVTPGLKGYSSSLTNTQKQIDAVDQSLASMVTAGNATEAADAFDRLTKVLAVGGVTVDEVRKQFPGYAAALETAAGATEHLAHSMNFMGPTVQEAKGALSGVVGPTGKATAATKEYADAADAAAGAARGEIGALTDLSSRMKAEIDPVFGLITAEQGLAKAQKDSAAAAKAHGKNSDEARAATRSLAMAAIDLQGKAGALSSTFDGKLSPSMIKTFKAAGLTDGQIKDVAKQAKQAKSDLDKYDGKYVANVSVTGAKSVGAALATLGQMQKALKSGTAPPGGWNIQSGALVKQINDPKLRASGGPVTGPGTETSDSIPAMLSNNEYVVKASSANKLGPAKLNYLNKYGELPAFAGGGGVGWPYPATAAMTRIPSKAEAMGAVAMPMGNWPSSPAAQRGDSGVWRSIVALINSTGPMSGHFGNAYRPGDPLWHGSGRAVDWMGFNQDRLASFLAARRPLELIHRTASRDYAYTRGVNKGSFNQSLMNAHRNHVHIAMQNGGWINEPVVGVGASGKSYSFAENGLPERVLPNYASGSVSHGGGGASGNTYYITVNPTPLAHPRDIGREVVGAIQVYEQGSGHDWRKPWGA